MKTLTRLFFCTFGLIIMYSCEPEDIRSEDHDLELPPTPVIGDSGDEIDIKPDKS